MVSSGYSTLINHRILDYPILGKHPDQPRYLIHEIHDWNNYPMKPFWPKKRFQIADANSDPLWSAYHLPMFVAARNRTLWSRAMTSASQRLDRGDHDGPGFVPKPNDRSVRETTPFQGFLSQFKDCVICPEKWEVSAGKSSYKALLEFKLTFDLGYRSMKLELQMWIDVNRILANCRVAHSVLQDLL